MTNLKGCSRDVVMYYANKGLPFQFAREREIVSVDV